MAVLGCRYPATVETVAASTITVRFRDYDDVVQVWDALPLMCPQLIVTGVFPRVYFLPNCNRKGTQARV